MRLGGLGRKGRIKAVRRDKLWGGNVGHLNECPCDWQIPRVPKVGIFQYEPTVAVEARNRMTFQMSGQACELAYSRARKTCPR